MFELIFLLYFTDPELPLVLQKDLILFEYTVDHRFKTFTGCMISTVPGYNDSNLDMLFEFQKAHPNKEIVEIGRTCRKTEETTLEMMERVFGL